MDSGASVIIVTYNSATTIVDCLLTVAATLRPQDEVLIVDNGSEDDTLVVVRQLRLPLDFRVLPQPENCGFSRGCNIGIENSDKEYVILLNPDTQVFGDWISRLTSHFARYPRTGAVGPLCDATIPNQHILTFLPDCHDYFDDPIGLLRRLQQLYDRRSFPSRLLIGFCLALRRDLLERFGGLDEDIFCGDDDMELSWRLREKGYYVRVALDVFVHHDHHTSFNTISESEQNEVIRQGSDVLFEKMKRYYHPQGIPNPRDYFGVDWWEPSVLKQKTEDEVFAPKLQKHDFSFLLMETKRLLGEYALYEAVQKLEEALKISANEYNLWYLLGCVYSSLGENAEAEFALTNAWSLEFEGDRAAKKLRKLMLQGSPAESANEPAL